MDSLSTQQDFALRFVVMANVLSSNVMMAIKSMVMVVAAIAKSKMDSSAKAALPTLKISVLAQFLKVFPSFQADSHTTGEKST